MRTWFNKLLDEPVSLRSILGKDGSLNQFDEQVDIDRTMCTVNK